MEHTNNPKKEYTNTPKNEQAQAGVEKKQWIIPEISVLEVNGNGGAGIDFASESSI